MKRCRITFETLLAYCEGGAQAATQARVRKHLETGCAACEREVAWIQRLLSAFQMENPWVPAQALAPARALFIDRYVRPETPSPLVQWARLLFDSRTQLTPAFARGEQKPARHQIYRADGYEIELWQEALPQGACYIIGQVLPRKEGAIAVPESVVMTGEQGYRVTVTPEASEFHLPSVPNGRYQVQVRLPDAEIRLPEVAVGL
jgi:hypothetical protein